MPEKRAVNSYYVDEAGDPTLFNRKGQVIVGKEGVSRLFMVGYAYLPGPELAKQKLEELRAELLADPYFKNVPSIQPGAKKTALCFHATDDLPEVRREVFRLLPELGAKVNVAIRRKEYLVKVARSGSKGLIASKYPRIQANPDSIYDDMIKRLFKTGLHTAEKNLIVFARRGKVRRRALQYAIKRAKDNFEITTGIRSDSATKIISAYPSQYAGLQVIDYYLWALQRMFERGEDRFFRLLAKGYRLIMDLNDTRNKPYGEWYSDSNPLKLEKIKPVAG